LLKGFKALIDTQKKDIDDDYLQNQAFITKESINRNFKHIFGDESEFMENNLYYYLSGGYSKLKVTLSMFISKMVALLSSNRVSAMSVVFHLYDVDRDGTISVLDLMHIRTFVP
jgi:Ca2+-binding EF-hand superfamily protein